MAPDKNTLLGLLAILLWSASVALVRSLSESLGPLATGASVYLTAGAFSTAHLLSRRGVRADLRALPPAYVFGCGALFAIYTTSFLCALGLAADRAQSIEVGLINYLSLIPI